jgi:hypothetical protein
MKRNVGSADRVIRVLLGLGIIAAGIYYKSWWGAVGVVPLFTAAIGWCPAYLPFGLSTCRTGGHGQARA